MTPTTDGDDAPDGIGPLCGAPATEERVVEGIMCPLCALHAAELDAERQD